MMARRRQPETAISAPLVIRDREGFPEVRGSCFSQEPAQRSRRTWHPRQNRPETAELYRVFGTPSSKSSCRLCDPRLHRQNCSFLIPDRSIPDGGKPGLFSSVPGRRPFLKSLEKNALARQIPPEEP